MLYLFWGRFSIAGYWIGRIFLIFFLRGTMDVAPAVNPVRILFAFDRNPPRISPLFPKGYGFYRAGVSGAILVFTVANHLLVGRHSDRKGKP